MRKRMPVGDAMPREKRGIKTVNMHPVSAREPRQMVLYRDIPKTTACVNQKELKPLDRRFWI
jgi:hypothetical protein